ncbi:MAG: endolytic transglycosylase MltG [Lentimicrobiaceae bacterium]|nr:endolytic transglycosylase MltG [Lentimicrobiaceae bacterium]MCO5265850.1 endolytic transglycosylase MltG [Lentimicrobium sp.]
MRGYYHTKYSGKRKSGNKYRRFFLWAVLVIIILMTPVVWLGYKAAFEPNVYTAGAEESYLTIPTGSNFDDVKKELYLHGMIIHRKSFEWIAGLKKYDKMIKPGRYKLTPDMGSLELVNLLRSGKQAPVKVIFNNIRTPDQLAGRISGQIEADSLSIINLLNDSSYLDSLGVTRNSLYTIIIPNTYEFYWNTNARSFINRMKSEADKFWNSDRTKKLAYLHLNKHEVITLASIVEKETNKNDERPRVAGVYLNRLEKGWLLEADPTLVFAHGNFEMRRVLNIHKQIDSPYNTYKYKGLPPGPICLPSVSSIDAVLNREQHNFMFFCAREDFSGYHNFARTLEQHNLNAFKYQQALNRRNIYK